MSGLALQGISKERNARILLETVLCCPYARLTRVVSIIHFICHRVLAYLTGNVIGGFHIGNMASKTHHGDNGVYNMNGV
jgi:hypothetical protein